MRRLHKNDSDSDQSNDEEYSVSFKRGNRLKKRSKKDDGGGDLELANGGAPVQPCLNNQTVTFDMASPKRGNAKGSGGSDISASSGTGSVASPEQEPVTSIPCTVIVAQKSMSVEYGDKTSPDSAIGTSPSSVETPIAEPTPKINYAKLFNGKQRLNSWANITHLSSSTEIMKKMGFKRDTGLGMTMDDCEISSEAIHEMEAMLMENGVDVDATTFKDVIPLEEEIQWIKPVLPSHAIDFRSISKWIKTGAQKTTIRDDYTFIQPNIQKEVLTLKACFNVLNQHQYCSVRSRASPFEGLGKGPFLSRAGLKIANLDAALGWVITHPNSNNVSIIGPNELFYFADICAGPGGFTEYILNRKKWEAKGFGMTLKGELDFDLWSSTVCTAENFDAFYGPNNDGDVYNPVNTAEFIKYVRGMTDGAGVHLMTADGGFDVENKELQEVLSSHIYLSQCYLALALVKPGGMFVCKLFDVLTPFTVGLIYLMYLSFDLVAIHKPKSSRAGNSERYLICKWKKAETETEGIHAYLESCHSRYWKIKQHNDTHSDKEAILELVPMKVLRGNPEFFNYIIHSNTSIAQVQAKTLKRMVLFCRDVKLRDPRQADIKRTLFEAWKIPHAGQVQTYAGKNPEKMFRDLHGVHSKTDYLGCQENLLDDSSLDNKIKSPFDWRVVVVGAEQGGSSSRGIYFSLGRDMIYRYVNRRWSRYFAEKLELAKDTVVYGEFVDEIMGNGTSQKCRRAFHIIDAMFLGGMDVRDRHYTARLELCIKFAKSMNKPNYTEYSLVRSKIAVRMENTADLFDGLENRVITGSGPNAQLVCPVDHTDETLPFIKPSGLLLIKITKEPWTMAVSRSSNRKYYFNSATATSSYELVLESIADFDYTMQSLYFWSWSMELKNIMPKQDVTDSALPIALPPGEINPHRLFDHIGGGWQAKTGWRRLSSSSSQSS